MPLLYRMGVSGRYLLYLEMTPAEEHRQPTTGALPPTASTERLWTLRCPGGERSQQANKAPADQFLLVCFALSLFCKHMISSVYTVTGRDHKRYTDMYVHG